MDSELYKNTKEKMQKCIANLKKEFSSIRTGQASPSLVEDLMVEVYNNQKMPIKNLASITISDPKTIHISVWDENNVASIDNGIRNNKLGLNPRVDGSQLFITIPDLTSERRTEFVKILKEKSEESKISIRNIRRDSNEKIKAEKDLSEDLSKAETKKIQNLTDDYIKQINNATSNKKGQIETI